jgi:hypothetical protein
MGRHPPDGGCGISAPHLDSETRETTPTRGVDAQRVYFDTQQLNYFIGPDTGPHPDHSLRRVRHAIKARKIEVVGSLDLLQELIEALPQAGKKSRRMMDLFFQLVGDRVLLPLSERHRAEAVAGGMLSEKERYLSPDIRRKVRRLAQSGRDAIEVAEKLFREKLAFLDAEKAVQQQIRDRLIVEGATKQAQLMRAWIADVDIDDWLREITEAGGDLGSKTVRPDEVPSASAFVAIRLARLARTIGEGRKLQGSDLADAHHVACGPYIDLLVTDDKELLNTLQLVRDRLSFEWISSPQFFATLP